MPLQRLPLTGFVLTGGMSRRMGTPKQDLLLDGETMLGRQLRVLRRICSTVAVLGRTDANTEAAGGEIVTNPRHASNMEAAFYSDELPGHGPLGGIYTGLMRTRSEYNFILGCDLPFLGEDFLRFLGLRALAARADVTAPESPDHRYQPLCAVYRRRVRGIIRSFLAQNENKTTLFFRHVRSETVRFAEIARAGFGPLVFVNMNTPEDYELVRRRSPFDRPKPIVPGATEA
ncbi:MAG TPA: molybdenum cofactor guanylyltransferase [Terriglobia bacterium]|nr:molybdenum cofactor guanylyltransferase [Terriglobia bacterium]